MTPIQLLAKVETLNDKKKEGGQFLWNWDYEVDNNADSIVINNNTFTTTTGMIISDGTSPDSQLLGYVDLKTPADNYTFSTSLDVTWNGATIKIK